MKRREDIEKHIKASFEERYNHGIMADEATVSTLIAILASRSVQPTTRLRALAAVLTNAADRMERQ